MHVRTVAVGALVFGLVSAPGSGTAQPAPAPQAAAQAAERQRQQDATPDTPGTGRFPAR